MLLSRLRFHPYVKRSFLFSSSFHESLFSCSIFEYHRTVHRLARHAYRTLLRIVDRQQESGIWQPQKPKRPSSTWAGLYAYSFFLSIIIFLCRQSYIATWSMFDVMEITRNS